MIDMQGIQQMQQAAMAPQQGGQGDVAVNVATRGTNAMGEPNPVPASSMAGMAQAASRTT